MDLDEWRARQLAVFLSLFPLLVGCSEDIPKSESLLPKDDKLSSNQSTPSSDSDPDPSQSRQDESEESSTVTSVNPEGSDTGGETENTDEVRLDVATTPEPPVEGPAIGVFGGGPIYQSAETVIPMLRESGFTMVVVWTIHVSPQGTLYFNNTPLIRGGVYLGNLEWPAQLAELKEEGSSVNRIEMAVGSWGIPDFENIQSLIERDGIEQESALYQNFALLRSLFPMVDAISFDDESNYDFQSTAGFSLMLDNIGFKISLNPYTRINFWRSLYEGVEAERPGLIDRVMLQVYDGGSRNDPELWAEEFGDLPLEVGLWSLHGNQCELGDSPERVREKLGEWRDSIDGGWMWLLDDMLRCSRENEISEYADAIRGALE